MSARTMDGLCGVVAQALNLPAGSIAADSSHASVDAWDSLGHLQVLIAVEGAYGVRFSTAEMPTLASITALAARLEIPASKA
jgi:acyl carrier protein